MTQIAIIVVPIALYLAILLVFGKISSRKTQKTPESYFLADRKLRLFVLLAAIFGTNMTAFAMMGAPGLSYHAGVSVWGMLAGPILFVMPLSFYLGYRCWIVAKKFGYITPVEFYRERFQSDILAILMFIGFVGWTVPYILTGLTGGGRILENITDGAVPAWVGALALLLVVGYYTLAGGMKATAWTNTLQTLVFVVFLLLAVIFVSKVSDGTSALLGRLRSEQPEALVRSWEGPFNYGATVSQLILFSFMLFAFPFVWIRMVAARSGSDLRASAIVYPIAIVLTWGPAILLGVWGASLVPGLVGEESDAIIFMITGQLLPTWIVAFAVVALFALIMSSMDAQVLTLSNMLSRDIVGRYYRSSTSEVGYARIFVIALLALTFGLSLLDLPGIFDIAQFAFTGFAAFYPVLIGGIFWRRATKWGAIASLLVGQALAVAGFLGWYPTVAGLEPVFWVVLIGSVVFVVVSMATPRQNDAAERFHAVWDAMHRRVGREDVPSVGEGVGRHSV